MEINGLANIHLIVDCAEEGEISPKLAKKIKEQLVLLERYMLTQADVYKHYSVIISEKIPYWHDVIANPTNFKTLKERMK